MSDVVILSGTLIELPTASKRLVGNFHNRPLYRTAGPYVIAHYLRKNNISVQVVDYVQHLTEEQLVSFLRKFLPKDKSRPSIIGISTTFFQLVNRRLPKNILNAIKTIKSEYPKVKLVAGGARANQIPLEINFIDYGLYSYAEDLTLELFNGLLGKTALDHKFKLNKLFTQDNVNFDITKSDFRFIKEDCIRPKESLPLEISRGCIFKCKFCAYPHIGKKKNDYIRCIDQIREELIYNFETFGTTNYYMMDDTFNETPDKVKAFYDMTQTLPFKINWCAYIRIDLLHRFPETAVWLKDSGLIGAFFGIESFHPAASMLIGKAWSGKHGKDFILELKNNIWNNQVIMSISLILGIPPETWDDIVETQQWLIDNNIDNWSWHTLSISGRKSDSTDKSEFESNPKKYGFTFPNHNDIHDWYHDSGLTKKQVNDWFINVRKLFTSSPKVGSWDLIEMLNYFNKEIAMSENFHKEYISAIKINRRIWTNLYFKMLTELPD